MSRSQATRAFGTGSAGYAAARLGDDNPLRRWITGALDGEAVRWILGGVVFAMVGAIAHDVVEIYHARLAAQPVGLGVTVYPEQAERTADDRPERSNLKRLPAMPGVAAIHPLSFRLEPDGVMSVEGDIDPGSAKRFVEAVTAHGDDVRVLSLDSPGGSLDDAMAIAREVRRRGLAVEIADGASCASSCPLLMAGGVSRAASAAATVAVHQFYAHAGHGMAPAQAMSDAQTTTARISRHLAEMGVDPALWLHALDTPPQALYRLSAEELDRYRLVTGPLISEPRTGRRR